MVERPIGVDPAGLLGGRMAIAKGAEWVQ